MLFRALRTCLLNNFNTNVSFSNTISRLPPQQFSRFWRWWWPNVSSPVTMLGNWSTTQPFWNTTQPARAPAPPSGTWLVLPRLLNWPNFLLLNRPLVLTVHQKDQESRQEGDGVSDGGEVCSVLLDGDHHHRLWHSVQNRGAAQCVSFSWVFSLVSYSSGVSLIIDDLTASGRHCSR